MFLNKKEKDLRYAKEFLSITGAFLFGSISIVGGSFAFAQDDMLNILYPSYSCVNS